MADDAHPRGAFALDEVGRVLLSALRDWKRERSPSAVPGIARSIIRFVVNIIPEGGRDTATTLETMRDEHLVRAVGIVTNLGVRPLGSLQLSCSANPTRMPSGPRT
ncbi:hypothetical protein [Streptomyces mirabilis]|uniref:hypothetical protein n=1 Tax=Streptomyces mirabilis TaxID=68239 RepID=UPI0034177C48